MINIGDFILIPTKNQSKEDWLNQRSLTVGGSDMGTLFNKNEYSSVTQLFYEKLGRIKPVDLSENSAVHYGSSFEDVVLRDSQYLDLHGKDNNHIKNFNESNKKASHLPFPDMIISNRYCPSSIIIVPFLLSGERRYPTAGSQVAGYRSTFF